jgi:hypothetical protein
MGADEGRHILLCRELVDACRNSGNSRDLLLNCRGNREEGAGRAGSRLGKGEYYNCCKDTDNAPEDYQDAVIFGQQKRSPFLHISYKPIYCFCFYF